MVYRYGYTYKIINSSNKVTLTLKNRECREVLVVYHWLRGLACPPSVLNWRTMAAPMVQLP